ncbi:MAG: sulfatase-like hydrolase/transferase [Saprospiraceae bacterium]
MYKFSVTLFALLLFINNLIIAQTNPNQPNILLIIADDLGVDASNGYQDSDVLPNTPNLDALRASDLTFKNAWASPVYTPTRANIMSGKYGIKTGVLEVPGVLETAHTSVFKEIATQTNSAYADALIGKWHLSVG